MFRSKTITMCVILFFIVPSYAFAQQPIPDWVRNIAMWWSEGDIPDDEFKNAITYLINDGIITIDFSAIERPFEELWFQVIYYTSEEWCNSGDYNEMMFYNEVADEYLLNYGYNPISHAPACLSVHGSGYDELNNIYDDVDLFIIIRDYKYGSSLMLEEQHVWGYWQRVDNNQDVIEICACSVDIESQWGVWLLTHELAHFVISDNQWSDELHEEWVHEIHNEIDECEGTQIDYYGYGTCTFEQQGIDYLDARGIRYDVMPYITQEVLD